MQYFSSWKMKSNSMQTENFGRDFQVKIYLKNLLLVEAHEIVEMQHLTLLFLSTSTLDINFCI